MADQIALPQVNIRPDVIGGDRIQPNPLDYFVTNFLNARAQKSSESAQARAHEIEQARLDLIREDMKFRQEQEKTKQAATDAQGGGLQALIKALSPTIEAQAQYTPPGQVPPALAMLGITPQNQQQGPQQPAQAPNPQGQAQSPQMDPMAVFSGIVSKLPAAAVPDFVQHFSGIAEHAQAQKDQRKAFDEADRMTKGILSPDQANLLKTARMLAESGAPKELWQAMLPQAQMELAKSMEEVRSAKNKREADKLATVQLAKMGMAPKAPVGMDEFVVDGAAKILAEHVGKLREQAQSAGIERAKTDRAQAVAGLEGTALEIAAMNPDWSPAQIKAAIKASPAYAGLPDGVVAKAALEAPSKAQGLNAPKSETQAKLRVVYGPGRAALATVNAMDAKGQSLGIAARLAQTDSKMAGITGGGIGGAIGNIPGALLGAGAGLIAAPVIRGVARESMSADQQRMWTAAQSMAAMIYRPETGAQASEGEVRQTIERYIPLNTDKPQTRALKRQLRAELDKTLASVSGLPPQLQKGVLDGLLSKQEQEAANAPPPRPGDIFPKGHLRSAEEIQRGVP